MNVEDVHRKNALYYTAAYWHADVVKVLLSSTNIVAVSGGTCYSPFSRAVQRGHAHLVKLFLDSRKVDVN
jgi:ankyrin repeat protein